MTDGRPEATSPAAENDGIRVVDDPDEHRYELWVDDELAGTIIYRSRDPVIRLVHTEVSTAFGGRGLGTRLIADALADIRARGFRLVPQCRFVRAYLRKHPEDEDLVAPAHANRHQRP